MKLWSFFGYNCSFWAEMIDFGRNIGTILMELLGNSSRDGTLRFQFQSKGRVSALFILWKTLRFARNWRHWRYFSMVLDIRELGRKFSELMKNIFVTTLKNLRTFGPVLFFLPLKYFLKTIMLYYVWATGVPHGLFHVHSNHYFLYLLICLVWHACHGR